MKTISRAADQVVGAFRMGQMASRYVLFYAGSQAAVSIEDGDLIGISVAAEDPTLPASEYGGTTNLLLRELRLRHDLVDVGGGVILRVLPGVELNLGFSQILWGRNISQSTSFFASFAVRRDTLAKKR